MDELDRRDVALLRAGNSGPLTLGGTNTWIVGRDPCWVVDPGPDLAEHLDAVAAEVRARGGAGALAITHDHHDHAGGIEGLRERLGERVDVAAMRVPGARALVDGDVVGPLEALHVPGHAPDHLVFLTADVAFTGDAVLGEGSVFVAPDPGALRGYLEGLERLRVLGPAILCPGHGPVVRDGVAKLTQYLGHRQDREDALVAAMDDGVRDADELLARVWADVDEDLRHVARFPLAAHLDKLAEEQRLPDGVGRPELPDLSGFEH
jgi:glyoxylase-like metal-dependent hydrolase (beta-lactamase superfamily II)